jgi:hypothetical protein
MENNLKVYGSPAPAPAEPPAKSEPPKAGSNMLMSAKTWLMANSELYFLLTDFVHHSPVLKQIAVTLGLVRPNLDGVRTAYFDPEVISTSARRVGEIGRH